MSLMSLKDYMRFPLIKIEKIRAEIQSMMIVVTFKKNIERRVFLINPY